MEGPIVGGRYELLGLLGSGGMARVYLVRHHALGTLHALKVLAAPHASVRLHQEGRLQGGLRSPHVVAVTDTVEVDGAPGLVMEYVPGPTLDAWLRRVRPTAAQADLLARGVLAGVAAAHRQGLVHRDLKPANVLLDPSGGGLVPKVADFGLAKVLDPGPEGTLHTRAGAQLGTPAYMPPEQVLDSSSVDARADVFALGATLYELVSGRRAFEGDSIGDVHARVLAGRYERIGDLRPELPRVWRDAIDRALALRPEDRFPDAGALAEAWERAGPAPGPEVWDAAALSAAEEPAAAPLTERTSVSRTGPSSETWIDDPPAVEAPPARPRPKAPPRRPWAAAAVGTMAAAFALWWAMWWALPEAPEGRVARVDGFVPTVSADPAIQELYARAWAAYLAADVPESARLLELVRARDPAIGEAHLLASFVLLWNGDVARSLEARRDAHRAFTGAEGPSADLARHLEAQGEAGRAFVDEDLWAHLERWPDDWLAESQAAAWCWMTDRATCERAVARVLDRPDPPPVAYLAASRGWAGLGDSAAARRIAEEGLAREPNHPALRMQQSDAALSLGDAAGAAEAARGALSSDPGSFDARLALALALLYAGDPAFASARSALADPTVPPLTRIHAHRDLAAALSGLGRTREALQELRAALALEVSDGTPLGQVQVWSELARAGESGGRPGALREAIDAEIALATASPEVPNSIRNRIVAYRMQVDALDALARGDVAGAEAALARMRSADAPPPDAVATVEREIAVTRRDPAGVRAHPPVVADGCGAAAVMAEALRRAGAPDRAAFEAVLASGCERQGTNRAALVAAHVGLAELGVDRAAHLAALDELWPGPDEDHPLVVRARALRG